MSSVSAVITGTGMSVPDRIVTNKDLEKIVDTSDDWITTRTGIKERRIAVNGELLSDHAVEAGRQALEAASLSPEEIDLIIVGTVTPDQPIPATACFIQERLGCKNAAAFDMQAGCSGYIYAQAIAKQFIVSKRSKHVLVIGAELLSKFIDWQDRSTCVIFADGAGATVMSEGEEPRGVLSSELHSDGSMADFISIPGGGCANPPSEQTLQDRMHYIKMRGNETFKVAVRRLSGVCREVLEKASLTADDVSLVIPHQANTRIINAVLSRLRIEQERCYVNIDRYGNTSAASVPIALDEAVRGGLVRPGDILLMAAFGAGLTWAGSVVRW